ncbi:MAG: VOC family protein [Pseudomonadota bacterium]
MLGYVTIGVSDMEKGKAYWTALLEPMGAKVIMDMGRIALLGNGKGPMLGICVPYDEKDQHPGNGNMLAFTAGSRENVDSLYAKAIELGGTDEGAPGERGPTFYGGYFRDPDGNKAVFFSQ